MADDKEPKKEPQRFALPAGHRATLPNIEPALAQLSYFHVRLPTAEKKGADIQIAAPDGLSKMGGEFLDARILTTSPIMLGKTEVKDVKRGSAALLFRLDQKEDATKKINAIKDLMLIGFGRADTKIISRNKGLINANSWKPEKNTIDLVAVIIPPEEHQMKEVLQPGSNKPKLFLASDLQAISDVVTNKAVFSGLPPTEKKDKPTHFSDLPPEKKEELKQQSKEIDELIKSQRAAEALARKNKTPLPKPIFTPEEIKIFTDPDNGLKKKLDALIKEDLKKDPKKNLSMLLEQNNFVSPDLTMPKPDPALGRFDINQLVGDLKMPGSGFKIS